MRQDVCNKTDERWDLPDCTTGLVGRARFVGRELRDLCRELRGVLRARRGRSTAAGSESGSER